MISIPLCYLHNANNADFYFNTQYAAATLVERYLIFLCSVINLKVLFLEEFYFGRLETYG